MRIWKWSKDGTQTTFPISRRGNDARGQYPKLPLKELPDLVLLCLCHMLLCTFLYTPYNVPYLSQPHNCHGARYITHFYCHAVEAGFYSDVVECLLVDPASLVRFPAGAGEIFSLYDIGAQQWDKRVKMCFFQVKGLTTG